LKRSFEDIQKDVEKDFHDAEVIVETWEKIEQSDLGKRFLDVYKTLIKMAKNLVVVIEAMGESTKDLERRVETLYSNIEDLRKRIDKWEEFR